MRNLRVGVLGVANIAVNHVIPAMQQADGCEVVAVASRDGSRAKAAASDLGIDRAHGSYNLLLAADDVDAVYVPLPNHLHAEWTIAALRAGKHVLCEKPLALDAQDAARMVATAQEQGMILMEGFMYRFHPVWGQVHELLDAGRIGEMEHIRTWFSYHNSDPDNVRNRVDAGGGALMDIGCYCIDAARLMARAEPVEVHGTMRIDPELEIDTLTTGALVFPSAVATFTCGSRMQPDQRLEIHGSAGRLTVDVPFNIPSGTSSHLQVVTESAHPAFQEPETITLEPVNQYRLQAEAFAAAVLEGREAPLPPQDGVANMEVVDRLQASAARW